MDEHSSDNTSEVRDLSLEERELALKEREIALKEREAEHKPQFDKTNAWFTSPLLIAIVSTIFGTAIGAALQGYSNFQLERQKFEFSLI
ncbi:MAG: hypothetical protein AB4372_40270 [Xenococcus sp. (in: cyanobacteria)]